MSAATARLLPGTPAGRIVLMACAGLALGERVLEASGAAPAWSSSYLDDLVCLPLVLALVLAVQRAAGRPRAWRLPAAHGLAVVALYVVCFEILLPRWGAHATPDVADAAAYAVGFGVFQAVVNRG